MEPNIEAEAPVVSAVKEQPKNNNGLKIVTALTSVVAICGIGFGVFGMMQSIEKDNQISDLKNQVTTLNNKIVSMENDSTNNKDTANKTNNDSATTVDNDVSHYMYIDDLGLRVKKPEPSVINGKAQDKSISGVSYATDNYRLYIWGTIHRDGDQAAGEGVLYANKGQIGSPYLIEIDISYTDKCVRGERFGEFDGKSLCYIETGNDVLTNTYDSNAMERYIKPTLEILKNHFTNVNNYSKF